MADAEMKAQIARPHNAQLGEEIVRRINQLAAISETPEHLARIFLTPEHRAAADLLLNWMQAAGMRAHLDAIGNVCGRYEGEQPGLPCLMLGSHYDTVRDAGKWDGPLGLITAISCVADLHKRGRRLPFAVEVTGFADEEGVRFASTLLGSRAVAGTFDESVLNTQRHQRHLDARGAGAVRSRSRPYRRGGAGSRRTARLCRIAHRAGTGAGRRAFAGRRGDGDSGRHAAGGASVRHGRPCRHGADGAAPRRAGRCRGMHRRDRGILPDRPGRAGRHRRIYPRDARRHQCDPGTGLVHHRHSRADRCASQARGGRYRPPDRSHRQTSQARAAARRHP